MGQINNDKEMQQKLQAMKEKIAEKKQQDSGYTVNEYGEIVRKQTENPKGNGGNSQKRSNTKMLLCVALFVLGVCIVAFMIYNHKEQAPVSSQPVENADTVAAVEAVPEEPISEDAESDVAKEVTEGYEDGHQWVDLGLSVKWATCNLGADSPRHSGYNYDWNDVARDKWSGAWRLPTKSEIQELIDECNWEWSETENGTGYNVTGKNGNSIFLPQASVDEDASVDDGDTNYWSSTKETDGGNAAYVLHFSRDERKADYTVGMIDNLLVRLVLSK